MPATATTRARRARLLRRVRSRRGASMSAYRQTNPLTPLAGALIGAGAGLLGSYAWNHFYGDEDDRPEQEGGGDAPSGGGGGGSPPSSPGGGDIGSGGGVVPPPTPLPPGLDAGDAGMPLPPVEVEPVDFQPPVDTESGDFETPVVLTFVGLATECEPGLTLVEPPGNFGVYWCTNMPADRVAFEVVPATMAGTNPVCPSDGGWVTFGSLNGDYYCARAWIKEHESPMQQNPIKKTRPGTRASNPFIYRWLSSQDEKFEDKRELLMRRAQLKRKTRAAQSKRMRPVTARGLLERPINANPTKIRFVY